MTNPHELLKTFTRKEQQLVKAIFFLVQTKKMRNVEKIFKIIKTLLQQERKDAKCRAKERFGK